MIPSLLFLPNQYAVKSQFICQNLAVLAIIFRILILQLISWYKNAIFILNSQIILKLFTTTLKFFINMSNRVEKYNK